MAGGCAGGASIADSQSEIRRGIENTRTRNGVGNPIAELQISDPEAVSPRAMSNVESTAVGRRQIDVCELLVCARNESGRIQVLFIAELEKRADIVGDIVVHATE